MDYASFAATIAAGVSASPLGVSHLFAAFAAGALLSAALAALLAWAARSTLASSPAGKIAALIHQGSAPTITISGGARISLVGVGPGASDLLTLAAARALALADVVITDRIASPELRALIPSHAEIRVSDKMPGKGNADAAQDDINEWGVGALRAGRRVVRLKVGDPFLFGRGGEEVLFYRSHGFEPEVIPGVSSALAGPLAAGIPVTHRGAASSLLIATGVGRGGALPPLPPYDPTRTLVLLMAVGRLPTLAADLGAAYPPDTLVAVIERATHADQRVTTGTLADIGARAEAAGVVAPAVIVVGAVVGALEAGGDSDSGVGVGVGDRDFGVVGALLGSSVVGTA